MAHRRPRQSTEQWESIIDDFHRSDLSANAYCQTHDLALATFHKWRRRFLGAKSPVAVPTHSNGFTELHPAIKPTMGTSSVSVEIGPQVSLNIRYEP